MATPPHPWSDANPAWDGGPTTMHANAGLVALNSTAASEDDGNEFDDLVCMASRLLDTPIAMIAAIEGEHFHLVAERGLGMSLIPREHAICRTLGNDTPLLMLPDAAADIRFRDDPAVARANGVRFYLGIALFGSTGLPLGVFSVADVKPRAMVADDTLAMFRRLARHAGRLIERREMERSHRIARQIVQTDFSAVVVFDAAGEVTFANPAAQAMFGPAIACGQPLDALFPPDLQAESEAAGHWLRAGHAHNAAGASYQLRVRGVDDDVRTLEVVRCAWLADGGNGMALVMRDITDSCHMEQYRRTIAQQDPLTGLPNRAALLVTLDSLRAHAEPLGVALLGLDNFRSINHVLGHAIGDTLLQVVACRLLARLPVGAHLARFSGDEFALVFPGTAVDAIEAQLQMMLREIARPCEVDYHRVHLEAGIGLAMDQPHADGLGKADDDTHPIKHVDSSELIARAGLAMQHAKRASGQRLRRFEPGMRTGAIDRRKLDLELHRACREGEFEVYYQPQVDLASACVTGAEALLRWRHPERGLLFPGVFIDALARSAIAPTVGRWILQRACRDATAWPEVNGRRLTVGVNLFPVQFDDKHFLDEVDYALVWSGLHPAQLELELTETIALHDDDMAEHALMQLRARGIRLAYDDFGTGYASMSMLHRLPVDRVKIDRSFVSKMMANRGDEAIVRSISLIARNFDLQVIAEGVETHPQAQFLQELGCHEVQGFLYSPALASAEFDRWLTTHIGTPQIKALSHA